MKNFLITFLCFLIYSVSHSQHQWETIEVDSCVALVVFADNSSAVNRYFVMDEESGCRQILIGATNQRFEVKPDLLFLNEDSKYFYAIDGGNTMIYKHPLASSVNASPETKFTIKGGWLFDFFGFGMQQNEWFFSTGGPVEGGECQNIVTLFCLDSLDLKREIVVSNTGCLTLEYNKQEDKVLNLLFWDRYGASNTVFWVKLNMKNSNCKIQKFEYPFDVVGGFGSIAISGNHLYTSCRHMHQGKERYEIVRHSFDDGKFSIAQSKRLFNGGLLVGRDCIFLDSEFELDFADSFKTLGSVIFVDRIESNVSNVHLLQHTGGLTYFNKNIIVRYEK